MAMKEIRQCDVTGSYYKVKTYHVRIETEPDVDRAEPTVLDTKIDLAPKALARLLKFIERGTKSPKTETTDGPTATEG